MLSAAHRAELGHLAHDGYAARSRQVSQRLQSRSRRLRVRVVAIVDHPEPRPGGPHRHTPGRNRCLRQCPSHGVRRNAEVAANSDRGSGIHHLVAPTSSQHGLEPAPRGVRLEPGPQFGVDGHQPNFHVPLSTEEQNRAACLTRHARHERVIGVQDSEAVWRQRPNQVRLLVGDPCFVAKAFRVGPRHTGDHPHLW